MYCLSGVVPDRGRDAPESSRADAGRILGPGVSRGAALYGRIGTLQD